MESEHVLMENFSLNLDNIKQFEYDYVNETIRKLYSLIEFIEKIFIDKTIQINFQAVYSRCHELCQVRMEEQLYEAYMNTLEKIVNSYLAKLKENTQVDTFFNLLIESFDSYLKNSEKISDSLLYLEAVKLKFNPNYIGIFNSSMNKFYSIIILNDFIKTKIFSMSEVYLKKLRENNLFDENFKRLLEIFTLFNNTKYDKDNNENEDFLKDIYYSQFIDQITQLSGTFYENYFKINFMTSIEPEEDYEEEDFHYCSTTLANNVTAYLSTVEEILLKEEHFFDPLAKKDSEKIIFIIIQKLLVANAKNIFKSGFKYYFINNSFNELSSVYKLFFYMDSESIKREFYNNFGEFVGSLIKNLENNFVKKNNFNKIEYFNFHQFIEEIYILKIKFTKLLSTAFEGNPKIEQIFKSQFEKLINKHDNFLDHFIILLHEEIKISIKNRSHSLTEFSNKFLTVFKLISDKDLFELEYRKYLSKRLLRNISMIKETEYGFYDLMKKESGANYVKRIENMINDIYISNDLNLEFRRETGDMNFYIKVLSLENWPLEEGNKEINKIKCHSDTLPDVLDKHILEFTIFYNKKFKNRQLLFVHDLSWAEVKFNINKTKYHTLVVSSMQMAIFLNLNKKKTYTIEEIYQLLNIGKDRVAYFVNNLVPLIKSKILNFLPFEFKDPKNIIRGSITPHLKDRISLNENFVYKDHKIILNNFKGEKKVDKSLKDEKEISPFLIEDRKHHIDSAIMKTLKQIKKVHFDILKTKIYEQVNNYFVPEFSLVKQRLDNLLDREFIARDKNDPNIYIYII